MHQRLFAESTLYQIGLRIRFQTMIEERKVPAFLRPSVRFPPILDSSPIGESHHLIMIHAKERSSKLIRCSFALIYGHVRTLFQILGIVQITIIETWHFCYSCQLGRIYFGVKFRFILSDSSGTCRKHSHSRFTSLIITFDKHIEDTVSGDTPITGRKSG